WSGSSRAPLERARVEPRPQQQPHPPLWIGSGASRQSIDLAAELGLGLVIPSIFQPVTTFVPYVDRYRRRFAERGHGEQPRVGACSHVHVARDSQLARARWRPYHMGYTDWVNDTLLPWGQANMMPAGPPVALDYDSLLRSSAICGSPAEVVDRILELHEQLGLTLHLSIFDHGGLPRELLDDSLELFAAEVMPALRRALS
ncbi:MAG: LLM class flavin-dependent oxidoreductase, partial [Myxococcales bacterium]|nr:LLM class flavin-dependent oxidoreductase [Myxococcales bacterium]